MDKSNSQNFDDPLQVNNALNHSESYDDEIQQQFASLKQYNTINEQSELDAFGKLLQKLRQNIQLLEMDASSKNNSTTLQQYKQQLKYYQNKYNVLEKQFLLNQHVKSTRTDPSSSDQNNQYDDDSSDEDLEYGRNSNLPFETQRLLQSSGDSLTRSLSLMNDIESTGAESLGVLKSQREQMERTKHKLRDVHGELRIGDQLIQKMTCRNYIIIAIVALLLLIVVVLIIITLVGMFKQ